MSLHVVCDQKAFYYCHSFECSTFDLKFLTSGWDVCELESKGPSFLRPFLIHECLDAFNTFSPNVIWALADVVGRHFLLAMSTFNLQPSLSGMAHILCYFKKKCVCLDGWNFEILEERFIQTTKGQRKRNRLYSSVTMGYSESNCFHFFATFYAHL